MMSRLRYPEETKREVVELAKAEGIAATAKERNISEASIRTWLKDPKLKTLANGHRKTKTKKKAKTATTAQPERTMVKQLLRRMEKDQLIDFILEELK